MVNLQSLVTAVTLASGALAVPTPSTYDQAIGPENNKVESRQGGYYFQNWSEGGSNIRCQNGQGGSFSANWNSKGGFVCGKGWSGGGGR